MIRRATTALVPVLCALLAFAVIGLPTVARAGIDVPIIPVDWEAALAGPDPTFLGFATPPANEAAAHDTVIYNGLVHIGIGDLQVDPETNILSLHPEGATGRLGVTAMLGTATSFTQEWLPFERDGSKTQPYLETVCITTNIGAVPGEHLLGGSRVRHGSGGPRINVGGAIEYSADYSAIGATSYTVEIYLDDALVTTATGLTGAPFVTTGVWPDGGGSILVADGNDPYGERGIPASRWQMIVETPILIVDFRYNGAGEILGDEIRIIPENVNLEPPYLTRAILRGRGIELLEISSETVDGGNNKGAFDAPAADGASASALSLVASPNPAPGGAARIDFAAAPVNAQSARLDIFDASGRNVRALSAVGLVGRSGSLVWDGRDDSGRAVPAGTYFLRLTAGEESATERVTVLR